MVWGSRAFKSGNRFEWWNTNSHTSTNIGRFSAWRKNTQEFIGDFFSAALELFFTFGYLIKDSITHVFDSFDPNGIREQNVHYGNIVCFPIAPIDLMQPFNVIHLAFSKRALDKFYFCCFSFPFMCFALPSNTHTHTHFAHRACIHSQHQYHQTIW